MKRHKTRVIKIGSVKIGGNNPVAIQSMTNTRTSDVKRTVKQIRGLEDAGCEIVRVAVRDENDAVAIRMIKRRIHIPLVADIHFDYRLALKAVESGADKIRINPGTMPSREHIRRVASACKARRIPIRVGVNSGSLLRRKGSLPAALVNSALKTVRFLESINFHDIVVSLKASDALSTIEANRLFSRHSRLPLHLGVTAAGAGEEAVVKSASSVAALLVEGIGDTIRISLTDSPLREVEVAREILRALGFRHREYEIIACPTCGRQEIDVIGLEKRVRKELSRRRLHFGKRNFKIAVMGCVVNGPGEAKDADIGITGGRTAGFIFKKGKLVRKLPKSRLIKIFLEDIKKCSGRTR
ncbi:MAG: flavodoxin-dependent (E)-4-hydroxy-3-methylbut-2-enyl-diphosphate synthase [Candidatus Omnitrophica bacterium]|nr:flavodoxin-dependent (E)-4-hydroxy-3-methylbut-2-enyl-diphosphate synthase [Candidatus Omnitrophota bacterium]